MRVGKSLRFRYFARLFLAERAERQKRARELLLCQSPEHVALVFFQVRAAAKQPPPRSCVAFDDGVMPRRDMAHAEASRQFQEFAEFHASVAVDARVWREPGSVGVYEGLYDVFAEFAFERKDVERYAEAFRDASRGLLLGALREQTH